METWRIMEKKAVSIDTRCCKSIIQAFTKGGYLKEAFNWLTLVGEKDFAHSVLPMCNIFLHECGRRQSLVDAGRCLELMEGQLVGKSEITYWELLKFAVLQKDLSAGYNIWKDCTKYYSPSIVSMRKFIWSFTRLNDLKTAYGILRHMVALAAQETASLSTLPAGRCQSSRIDVPIPSYSEPHEIGGLKGIAGPRNFLFETASETEEGMQGSCMDQSYKEKQSFHNIDNFFIPNSSALDPSHIGSRVSNICSFGIDNLYLELEKFTELNLENIEQPRRGFRVFNTMDSRLVKKTLRRSFNNVIHACAQARNCKLVEYLLMQMYAIGLEPSGDTYDGFVKAVIYGKVVAYAMKVIQSMEKGNIKPYNDTLAALSMGHSKVLKLDIAEDLLGKISDGLPKFIHSFNAILVACDIMDQPDRAVRISAKLKKLKIKSNIKTYERLYSLFGNVNIPYEKGNMLSHADVAKRITAIETDMIRCGVHHSYTSMRI